MTLTELLRKRHLKRAVQLAVVKHKDAGELLAFWLAGDQPPTLVLCRANGAGEHQAIALAPNRHRHPRNADVQEWCWHRRLTTPTAYYCTANCVTTYYLTQDAKGVYYLIEADDENITVKGTAKLQGGKR